MVRSGTFASVLVAAAFLVSGGAALWYVLAWSSAIPFMDDVTIVQSLRVPEALPEWLWGLHNEHRVPLPKLLLRAVVSWTWDLRVPMVLHLLVLAAPALGFVLTARKLRGRTTVSDAFFPLLWLQLGNFENLLMAFDVCLAIAAALTSFSFLLLVSQPGPSTVRRSLLLGLCLLALPLCGGAGLVWSLSVLPAVAVAAFLALRRGDTPRTAPLLLLVLCAATVLVTVLYFRDFETPTDHEERGTIASILRTAASFLSMGFGAEGYAYWPAAPVAIGAALVGVVYTLGKQLGARSAWSALFLASNLALALSVGWGRGVESETEAGSAVRYVTLACPFLSMLYLSSVGSEPRRLSTGVQVVLLAALLVWTPGNVQRALAYGKHRRTVSDRVVSDVQDGWSPQQVAARNAGLMGFKVRQPPLDLFVGLRELGFAPYDVETDPSLNALPPAPPYFMFETAPTNVTSPEPTRVGRVNLLPVLVVRADAVLEFAVPEGASSVEARCGLHPIASSSGRTNGIAIRVAVPGDDGQEPTVLWERSIAPGETDGPQTLEVELPASARELRFTFDSLADGDPEMDWGYWSGIRFR